jgi:hypothetical protein
MEGMSVTEECDCNTQESDLYIQSAIYIRRMWFCTQECDFHKQSEISKCDFNTQENDFYTQSVITTRTSVISICMSVIPTRKVWFSHTKSDLDYHESDYNTHKLDFYTRSAFSTRYV